MLAPQAPASSFLASPSALEECFRRLPNNDMDLKAPHADSTKPQISNFEGPLKAACDNHYMRAFAFCALHIMSLHGPVRRVLLLLRHRALLRPVVPLHTLRDLHRLHEMHSDLQQRHRKLWI